MVTVPSWSVSSRENQGKDNVMAGGKEVGEEALPYGNAIPHDLQWNTNSMLEAQDYECPQIACNCLTIKFHVDSTTLLLPSLA
jgi:hypothetical protein